MKIIKNLCGDIACNIREAREKILKAYEMRSEDMDLAIWQREMAAAHLAFNDKGHSIVTKIINQYRMSDEYKNDPSYADGMMAAWNEIHNEQIRDTAEVKAMIDAFKKEQ